VTQNGSESGKVPQSDFAPDQTCWSRDDKGWRARALHPIKGRHYIIIDTIVNLFKSNFEFIVTLIIVTRKLIVPDQPPPPPPPHTN